MTAMRLPLSDAELAAALTPNPRVVAPAGVTELIAAEVRLTRQRRLSLLRWPRPFAPIYPDQRNRWALVLAAALLTLALLAAAVAASRLLDRSLPHGNGDIYVTFRGGYSVVSPDGATLVRQEFPGLDYPSAAWSPRGDVLAYWGAAHDHQSRVIVAKADGSIVEEILPGDAGLPTNTIPGGIGWSPDGSSLILDGDIHGVSHIFRIDLAQPRFVDLTPEPTFGRSPVWSALGDIAFVPFDQTQWGRRPWVMSPDGQGAHPLTAELPDDMRVDWVTWTPDGRRLLIQASNGDSRIYVVDRDGSRMTRVVSALQYPSIAALSPDGRKLLVNNFLGALGDEDEVYLADVEDDGLMLLMRNADPLGYSPDGQVILVTTPACAWVDQATNSCNQAIWSIDPVTAEGHEFVSADRMDAIGDATDHGGVGGAIWRAQHVADKAKTKTPNRAH
jgi:dipeptidyl aminopeptidase/acylaminoacyl peptidase